MFWWTRSMSSQGKELAPYDFNPDWASPPGATIADVLRERKLSTRWLAPRLGLTFRQTVELIHGKRELTAEMGLLLASCLYGTQEFWLEREKQYREQVEEKLRGK